MNPSILPRILSTEPSPDYALLDSGHKGDDPGDADPAQQPAQNTFFAALAQNGVHYYISGHWKKLCTSGYNLEEAEKQSAR